MILQNLPNTISIKNYENKQFIEFHLQSQTGPNIHVAYLLNTLKKKSIGSTGLLNI